jgi:hypothetical protein
VTLFGTGRREGCLAALFLVLLAITLHAPGLFFGRTRLAVDLHRLPPHAAAARAADAVLGSEAATNQAIVLPAMRAAGAALRDGEWPLWNRDARLGEPFAISGAPLCYPFAWPLLLGDDPWLLDFVLALHTALACVGMFRFLRAMPLQRYSAFVGGGLYGLGWHLVAELDRLPQAAAAAWLPVVLELAWRMLISRRRQGLAVLLGLAGAMLILTGAQTIVLLSLLLAAALLLAHVASLPREDRRSLAGASLGAAAVMALLSAPAWLPGLEHVGALAPSDPRPPRLQLAGLLGLLAPDACGGLRPSANPALAATNPGADPLELALRPGALALLLLVLGFLRPKRQLVGLFWVLGAAIGLLLTLDGPWAELFQEFGLAAAPAGSALILTHFALTVLCAAALENFFEAPLRRGWTTPLAFVLLLLLPAAVVVFGWLLPEHGIRLLQSATHHDDDLGVALRRLRGSLIAGCVPLVLLGALFLFWRRLGILRFKAVLASLAFADLLAYALVGVPRVKPDYECGFAAAVPADQGRVLPVLRQPLPPSGELLARGVPVVTSAGNGILQRTLRYLLLVDPTLGEQHGRLQLRPLLEPQLLAHPLLASAGVGIAVGASWFHAEGLAPLGAGPLVATSRPTLHVARRERAPAPAWIVRDAERAANQDDALARVHRASFDPFATVVLESAPATAATPRATTAGRVTLLEHRRNQLRLRADAGDGAGWLVLADAWAPGWRARVDGAPATVLPANVALRALPLPPGVHEIELRYVPWSARAGVAAAAAGLVLALVLALASLRR